MPRDNILYAGTASGRAVATDRRFSKRRGAPILRHRVVAGLTFGAGLRPQILKLIEVEFPDIGSRFEER
jgi:hypothetical protein